MCHSPKKFCKKVDIDKDSENKELGRKGEEQAVKYLKKKGWKIIKRNYVNPFGEIDIIANKGEVIAFIEVKTRRSDIFGIPSEAVNDKRKLKYIQGANFFFAKKMRYWTMRFDIIEIYRGEINHIENAFYPN